MWKTLMQRHGVGFAKIFHYPFFYSFVASGFQNFSPRNSVFSWAGLNLWTLRTQDFWLGLSKMTDLHLGSKFRFFCPKYTTMKWRWTRNLVNSQFGLNPCLYFLYNCTSNTWKELAIYFISGPWIPNKYFSIILQAVSSHNPCLTCSYKSKLLIIAFFM